MKRRFKQIDNQIVETLFKPEQLHGKRGLIVKLRYIGDTLSILPVVDNIKERIPELEIDVMVNKGTESILSHHPGIRRIWAYDRARAKKNIVESISYQARLIRELRAQKYDFVIDFTLGDRASFICFLTGAPHRISYSHSSTLSKILMNRIIECDPFQHHIVDLQLMSISLLGVNSFVRELRIPLPDSLSDFEGDIFPHKLEDDGCINIAIHPGARGELRRWKPENFGQIAKMVMEKYDTRIFLFGGPGEQVLIDEVEFHMGENAFFKSSDLNLMELAMVLKKCHLFIGNDSAPGHIAAGVGCYTITLFGPTFPHMWKPLSPKSEVIFKNPPCCGCRQIECIRPDNNCMDMISVEEVWEIVNKIINKIKRSK